MKTRILTVLLVSGMASIAGTARADIVIGLTDPGGLAANDRVDWGQLGPDGTTLSASAAATSDNGLGVAVVSEDLAGLIRYDQAPLGGWAGNFTPGDHLLNNNSSEYHPLTISFASPVSGAGTNIQLDAHGTFTATIEAFHDSTSLGTFTTTGDSNDAADGSAPFIGVVDTKAEITSIVLGISTPPNSAGDFAINSLLIREESVTATPEPATIGMVVWAGALAGLRYTWLNRKRAR